MRKSGKVSSKPKEVTQPRIYSESALADYERGSRAALPSIEFNPREPGNNAA